MSRRGNNMFQQDPDVDAADDQLHELDEEWEIRRSRPTRQKVLNFADVQKVFHLPLKQAEVALGVSRQIIKRCCLQNGTSDN